MSINHDVVEIHLNEDEIAGLVEIETGEETLLAMSSLDDLITDCEIMLDQIAERENRKHRYRRKTKESDFR